MARSKRADVVTKEVVAENLRCELTDAEVQARGGEVALDLAKIEALRAKRKTLAAELKDEIDEVAERVRLTAREVREKACWRDVETRVQLNYADGVCQTIRTDTGEIVRSRPLSAAERQPRLAFDGEGEEQVG